MIRRRFSVFSGVGPKTDQAIRSAGISDWQALLDARHLPGMSQRVYDRICRQACEWAAALDRRDAAFFARNLPARLHWLLYDEFRDSACCIDIETTGLAPGFDDVTVVGIYDGRTYRALVRGESLTRQAVEQALEGCKLLVSYYGSVFDIPFLRRAFPGFNWDLPHLDLCFAARRLGLTGGLKVVESLLGIRRPDFIRDVDGFEAVRLWYDYSRRRNASALTRLIEYNRADTTNLARLAPIICQGLRLCAGAQDF